MFQVVSTTTDNSANFVKAFREFGKDSESDDNDTDVASDAVEMISLEERIDESADTDYALPSHMRCSAHTLNLLATKDVESVPGWSSGARACFTKVIMGSVKILTYKTTSSKYSI